MRANRKALLIVAAAALCAFVLWPEPAQADPLDFTLSATTVSGAAGTTIELFAMFTNTGADQISFTGDTFSLTSSFFTGDDSPFTNFLFFGPSTLDSGQSTGPFDIFNITIDPSAISGLYGLNSFTADWMDNVTGASFATSQNFTVGVTSPIATPEPSVLSQLLLGLCALALGFRRFRGRDPVADA